MTETMPASHVEEQSRDFPLVSVVTPSYNMGRFIEETIASVFSQDYPNIEYIVMDGGSTDETLAILERYRGRLQFQSGSDGGAAAAVNQGFAQAHGEIFAYLNADDTYLPGAVSVAVKAFLSNPDAGVVYGDGDWVDARGRKIGPYPTRQFDASLLERECFICQPASFIRRSAWDRAGGLRASLQFTFDYDLWIRIAGLVSMTKADAVLANSRMHKDNKTIGQRRAVLYETMQMLYGHFRYVPSPWVIAYACHLVDRKDQFFEATQLSAPKFLLAWLIGVRQNRRHPVRFTKEWAGGITLKGLVQRARRVLSSLAR